MNFCKGFLVDCFFLGGFFFNCKGIELDLPNQSRSNYFLPRQENDVEFFVQ